MNLEKMIFEMYEQVMFSIENNLFEARLNSKESFRRAIALWKNLPQAKKETEAKRILKAAKREGYTVKQKEILAYADKIEDYSKLKAKKSVRRELRAKKKAKRDERFEQVKANVDEKDIEDRTRIELLAIAVKKGLKTTPKMNRQELIDLIQPPKKEEENSKQNELKQEILKFDENVEFVSGSDKQKEFAKKIRNDLKNFLTNQINDTNNFSNFVNSLNLDNLTNDKREDYQKIKEILNNYISYKNNLINNKSSEFIINNRNNLDDNIYRFLNSEDIKKKYDMLEINGLATILKQFEFEKFANETINYKEVSNNTDNDIIPLTNPSKKVSNVKDVDGKEFSGFWNGKGYNSKREDLYRIYIDNKEVFLAKDEMAKIVKVTNKDEIDKKNEKIVNDTIEEINDYVERKIPNLTDRQKNFLDKFISKLNIETIKKNDSSRNSFLEDRVTQYLQFIEKFK